MWQKFPGGVESGMRVVSVLAEMMHCGWVTVVPLEQFVYGNPNPVVCMAMPESRSTPFVSWHVQVPATGMQVLLFWYTVSPTKPVSITTTLSYTTTNRSGMVYASLGVCGQ